MRLYALLVRFFRVATRLYFAEIHVSGSHRVPRSAPMLLAANHPGSLLDAVLLGTRTPRPIHFLARSGLFRWPVIALLFRQLGAIPVYRARETSDHSQRNLETFAHVYRLLEQGGCIGIFPEGRNSPHGRIGELRTGTARIALEAERRNGFRLGSAIVPVGIAFERRGLLMAAVVLRFGTPIRMDRFAGRYREEPEATVTQLTGELQAALRRLASQQVDDRLQRLANDLVEIGSQRLGVPAGGRAPSVRARHARRAPWLKRLRRTLLRLYRRSSPAASRAAATRIYGRERLASALARAVAEEPQAVTELQQRVERYKDHLGQVRLRESLANTRDAPPGERFLRLRMTLYAVGVAPVALFGLIHNLLPYGLTAAAGRIWHDPAVRVFAHFGIGVLAFGITYAALAIACWQHTALPAAWIAVYIASLPASGIVALDYRRRLLVYRDRILVRTLLWRRRDLSRLLQRERAAILTRVRDLTTRYAGHD